MDRLYLTLLQVLLDIEHNNHIPNKNEKNIYFHKYIYFHCVFQNTMCQFSIAVVNYHKVRGLKNTNLVFYSRSSPTQISQAIIKAAFLSGTSRGEYVS